MADALSHVQEAPSPPASLPEDVAAPLERSWTLEESYAFCTRLTKAHYENFPVGSILVPAKLQPAIHSLYAFMRTADDFADEGRRPGDEARRLAWLESWQAMLMDCVAGQARHPIFIALAETVRTHALPVEWLRDLLKAFTMDVTVRRYESWNDLLNYCRYSANPVGRLILTLSGYRDEQLYRLSDAICSALQLANHWQDVAVDLEKDRIYLPMEDLSRFGMTDRDLNPLLPSREKAGMRDGTSHTAQDHPSPVSSPLKGEEFKRLIKFECDRAWELFRTGQSLSERVKGRLRLELRFTWLGGTRILEKIESQGYDTLHHRPVVSRLDWIWIAGRTLLNSSTK